MKSVFYRLGLVQRFALLAGVNKLFLNWSHGCLKYVDKKSTRCATEDK